MTMMRKVGGIFLGLRGKERGGRDLLVGGKIRKGLGKKGGSIDCFMSRRKRGKEMGREIGKEENRKENRKERK